MSAILNCQIRSVRLEAGQCARIPRHAAHSSHLLCGLPRAQPSGRHRAPRLAASDDGDKPPAADVENDFWEGEQWEGFGNVASVTIPTLVVLALGVGFIAAQTYEDGATVFLENARGPEDTARLYTLD